MSRRNGEQIYRKSGPRKGRSSLSGDSASDDAWDDRILTHVYDRAVSTARDHVAKRLAMKTNSTTGNVDDRKFSTVHWKVGDECRAVYSEDGLEYEATLVKIQGDSCIVSYVGYENEEQVELSELKPSLGKIERYEQTLEGFRDIERESSRASTSEAVDEGETKNTPKRNNVNGYGSNSSKRNGTGTHGIPPLSSFRFPPFEPNADPNCHIPLPPPPPFSFPSGADDSLHDDRSLSVMLISWYMSGYYTGLYQGQKMKRSNNS